MRVSYTGSGGETQLDNSPAISYFARMLTTEKQDQDEGIGGSDTPPALSEPSGSAGGERNDNFRQSRIIKFFPQSNYGFVRDHNGKEIYFHIDEIRFVGPKQGRPFIKEGIPVGVDVGVTSRGLRVTRMKIY
jgi:cold shock CspA family protein